jgi:hypothetical protein
MSQAKARAAIATASTAGTCQHGLVADCAPFRLLPRAVNFMTADDVAKLVRTVKAVVGDAKLVIIDTVARAFSQAPRRTHPRRWGCLWLACDAIRETCGVAVIGVHHSGKDEDRGMRGSSSLEGAGDCVLHLKRKDDSSSLRSPQRSKRTAKRPSLCS